MNNQPQKPHRKRHRGGKKHNKNRKITNASAPLFVKKHDSVAILRAEQIAEGRRMMRMNPDA